MVEPDGGRKDRRRPRGLSFAGLFFGVGTAYLLYRLVRPTPLLVIGEDGLVDRSSLGAVGELSWREVAGVKRLSVGGSGFITLHAYSPSEVISRQRSPFKRLRLRYRVRKGWGTAAIPEALLPDPDDAFAAVQSAWREWRERNRAPRG